MITEARKRSVVLLQYGRDNSMKRKKYEVERMAGPVAISTEQ
jgi:hypothetical protein